MKSVKRAELRLLQSADLKRVPWLVHGFTTRPGGFTTSYGGRTLNVGFTKDDLRASVERNRKQALLAAGAATKSKPWPLITLRQVHSDIIHVVRSRKPEKFVGDGMVTDLRGLALGVLTADCFPVLLVDTKKKAVGAFHAGWRGTVKRIVEKGVGICGWNSARVRKIFMRRLGRASSNARLKLARKWKKLFIRSLLMPLNFSTLCRSRTPCVSAIRCCS